MMLWTAFIWGVGVSCGTAVGMILFVILWTLLNRIAGPTKDSSLNEKSLIELTKRNELTEKQIMEIARIAIALESGIRDVQ
jgi:hypothetical protein